MAALHVNPNLVPPSIPGVGPAPAPAHLHPNVYAPLVPTPAQTAMLLPVMAVWGWHCDDRVHACGPPAHPGPCSQAGIFPDMVPPPHYIPPLVGPFPPVPVHQQWKACARNGMHGAGYRLCAMCIRNNRRQPWFEHMLRDMTTIRRILPHTAALKANAPAQPINTWRRFLTHMCRACEDMERWVLWHRLHSPGFAHPIVGLRQEMIGRRRPPPYHTCTCLYEAQRDRNTITDMCIRHLFQHAGARHNARLNTRQQNDDWLRKIGKSPGNPGRLTFVSHQKTTGRAKRKVYRACRCGEEIVADALPRRVAFCMGCEGVVSHRDYL